ncbi:MAG: DUF3301 domain-containing protein [Marinicella sp.]|nr:DUF3301 domain-containing protein [Xanthomonadales bacterium]
MAELSALLALGLLGYYWYNQVSALDQTRSAGKQITQQKGWVFLDDSLIQKYIRIRPRRGKLSLLRVFEFEFSDINAHRFTGSIVHHGGQVIEIKYFHENGIETIPLH